MGYKHLEDKTRRAMKQHRCVFCARFIDPGDEYVARSGIRDGRMETLRLHVSCEEETRGWSDEQWAGHLADGTKASEAPTGKRPA